MNIILLGKPGAGKGTQAQRLIQDINFTIISPGNLIREEIKKETPFGLKIKDLIEQGKLLDDALITELIIPHIKKADQCLFDGVPRTIHQADILDSLSKIDKVIFLHVDDEVVLKRLTSRCMVSVNGKQLSFANKELAEEFVAKNGGEVFQRKDDIPQVIQNRLDEYREKTKPLIDYYKEKGIFHSIDANNSVENVHVEILRILE